MPRHQHNYVEKMEIEQIDQRFSPSECGWTYKLCLRFLCIGVLEFNKPLAELASLMQRAEEDLFEKPSWFEHTLFTVVERVLAREGTARYVVGPIAAVPVDPTATTATVPESTSRPLRNWFHLVSDLVQLSRTSVTYQFGPRTSTADVDSSSVGVEEDEDRRRLTVLEINSPGERGEGEQEGIESGSVRRDTNIPRVVPRWHTGAGGLGVVPLTETEDDSPKITPSSSEDNTHTLMFVLADGPCEQRQLTRAQVNAVFGNPLMLCIAKELARELRRLWR